MPEPLGIYRFSRPITLLLWQDGRYRLTQLPEQSVITVGDLKPDANRMIHGLYRGNDLLLFSVDLEERAELLLTTLDVTNSLQSTGPLESEPELSPLDLAQRVADELLGRGHLAFVVKPPKKTAGSANGESSPRRQPPLGRCS